MSQLPICLSIIVPAYNEAARLAKTAAALGAFLASHPFRDVEIIAVDDGSTDDTAARLADLSRRLPISVVSYPRNRGKGYALRQGFANATGEYVLMMDADMSTPFSALDAFLPHLAARESVVIGTRKAPGAAVLVPQPWYRRSMGLVFTRLAVFITGVPVSDFTCGFKLFSRDAARAIAARARVDRWSFDAEFLYLAKRLGFPIREVPVSWSNDEGTSVRLGTDVIRSFLDLVAIRLRGI